MKTPLLAIALTLGATASLAQDHASHHPASGASAPEPASASAPVAAAQAESRDLTDGEIRRVDKGSGKVTIKHGPIRNLDMPGMTMVFLVRDKSLLNTLKTGDKVRFRAEADNGAYIVTDVRVAD